VGARFTWLVGIAVVLTGAAAVPSAGAGSLPRADIALRQFTDVSRVHPGDIVRFISVATNRGPASTTLDVKTLSDTAAARVKVVNVNCNHHQVSSDGQFCEYGEVAPGTQVRSVITVRVLPTRATHLRNQACAFSEGDTSDPVAGNDCATAGVTIVR
jgi:hypothetical protein